MKFERISENQIKCTLTNSDLVSRQIKLSELAYGSAKARELFQDLMTQASVELGFDTTNMPIMVEAIPVPGDCLVLIITRVDDPEELDTRFSSFSSIAEAVSDNSYEQAETSSNEILEIFRKFSKRLEDNQAEDIIISETDAADSFEEPQDLQDSEGSHEKLKNSLMNLNELLASSIMPELAGKLDIPALTGDEEDESSSVFKPRMCAYKFPALDSVTELSLHIRDDFSCRNTLYKDTSSKDYTLVIFEEEGKTDEFDTANIVCAEFGAIRKLTSSSVNYFEEHYDVIIRDKALQVLKNI